MHDHRQRQHSVRNRAAERRIRRTDRIDVDVLMIFGNVGEPIDPILIDREPIRFAELLPDDLEKLLFCHGLRHTAPPAPLPDRYRTTIPMHDAGCVSSIAVAQLAPAQHNGPRLPRLLGTRMKFASLASPAAQVYSVTPACASHRVLVDAASAPAYRA